MRRRKNWIAVIIAILLMSMFLTGCDGGDHESAYIDDEGTSSEESDTSSESEELSEAERPEGLVLIREVKVELNGHRDLYQYILYDPETKIMYSYVEWIDGGGFCEMHNPDGTPRLYDSE